jgi:hypothetical protein
MTATTLRGKWCNSVQIQYQNQNQKKLAAMAWFICVIEIAFTVSSGCHVKVYALDVLQPRTLAASYPGSLFASPLPAFQLSDVVQSGI